MLRKNFERNKRRRQESAAARDALQKADENRRLTALELAAKREREEMLARRKRASEAMRPKKRSFPKVGPRPGAASL